MVFRELSVGKFGQFQSTCLLLQGNWCRLDPSRVKCCLRKHTTTRRCSFFSQVGFNPINYLLVQYIYHESLLTHSYSYKPTVIAMAISYKY